MDIEMNRSTDNSDGWTLLGVGAEDRFSVKNDSSKVTSETTTFGDNPGNASTACAKEKEYTNPEQKDLV